MTDKQRQEYGRTLKQLAEELPEVTLERIVEACEVFAQAERRLSAIYTRHCNGYKDAAGNWDEKAQVRDDEREQRWEETAKQAAQAIGLGIGFTHLPAGAIRLALPSGRTNCTDGWAINWVW